MKYFILVVFLGLLFYSCNKDNPVVPPTNSVPSNYSKIDSAQSGNFKLEIWSASGNKIYYGYNNLGFKVFISGAEQKTGFVKFLPKMYHFVGGPSHSSPISPQYNYDAGKGLFTGYACFTMLSDSTSFWWTHYNYNNTNYIDSVLFYVMNNSQNQVRVWDDIVGGNRYILTLVTPFSPVVGSNNFSFILHSTTNDFDFTEVNNAEMFTRVWMESMGHGSSGNINPASQGSGRYDGKANFTMAGGWAIYDSIKVNGNFITNSPPPKFTFVIQ